MSHSSNTITAAEWREAIWRGRVRRASGHARLRAQLFSQVGPLGQSEPLGLVPRAEGPACDLFAGAMGGRPEMHRNNGGFGKQADNHPSRPDTTQNQ